MTKRSEIILGGVIMLRDYYTKPNPTMFNCPLCHYAYRVNQGGDYCRVCPWVVLGEAPANTHTACFELDNEIVHKRRFPTPAWKKASIKRLTRWARQIRRGTYENRLRKQGL